MAHVGARDLEVGLRAHHLDLAEQVVEEGPLRRHVAQPLDPRLRARRLRQRRARAEPAGEHEADLRPAEAPRDGADAGDSRARAGPERRPRAEARLRQLVDRRRRAEEREQRLVLVHEIAIDAERRLAQLAHRGAERLHLLRRHRLGPPRELLEQCAGERHFDRPLGDIQQAELL